MQPYPNPNYYMQYSQFNQLNPYADRLAQMQQYQSSLQQPMQPTQQFQTLGKIVESLDIVKATDIPMDGNMYYFPKADGSEVYSKQWLSNGTTRILAFKPVLEDDTDNLGKAEKSKFELFAQVLDSIQNDIKTLTDKVDKINKPTRVKKENAEDE